MFRLVITFVFALMVSATAWAGNWNSSSSSIYFYLRSLTDKPNLVLGHNPRSRADCVCFPRTSAALYKPNLQSPAWDSGGKSLV